MQPWEIIILAFSGLSVFNSLALISYLITTRKTEKSDVFLYIILIGFIIQVVHALMEIFNFETFAYKGNLYLIGIYLQGPSMYLLLKKTLKPQITLWPGQIALHYLPWLVFGMLPFNFNAMGILEWIAIYLVGLQSLAYILLCVKPYLSARHFYMKKEKKYYFITYLFPAFAALWVTYPLSGITMINYQIIEIILHSLFLYYLIVIKIKEPINDKNKYRVSGIDKTTSSQLYDKIHTVVIENELFLNPDISLRLVAKKAAVPVNLVSQAINQNAGLNFRDYINRFRIKKAQLEIIKKTTQGFTIASVAYDCGFNSLSAFNRAFLKTVGKTPSEFIKTSIS